MRELKDISAERDSLKVIVELTSAFEGIASMHISQIKDLVQNSEKFFADLWRIYQQIRVDEFFRYGRSSAQGQTVDKDLLIVITAEGSFSGDIDERVIHGAMDFYKSHQSYDIIVIGHHGEVQLMQNGIHYADSFKLPEKQTDVDLAPIMAEVQKYNSTTVYYPSYVSLMTQDVRHIQLSAEVAKRGQTVTKGDEVISEDTYIFEPSTYAVVDHLERSMIQIMLGEIILESKLAQYASRFRAMHTARDKADESYSSLSTMYNHARRHIKDERLKEIINGLRTVRG